MHKSSTWVKSNEMEERNKSITNYCNLKMEKRHHFKCCTALWYHVFNMHFISCLNTTYCNILYKFFSMWRLNLQTQRYENPPIWSTRQSARQEKTSFQHPRNSLRCLNISLCSQVWWLIPSIIILIRHQSFLSFI